MTPLGCFTDLGSSDPNPCFDRGGCNGVEVFCLNHGIDGAVDESGGDAGGEVQRNYWWRPVAAGDVASITTWDVCGDYLIDDDSPNSPYCCILDAVTFQKSCWMKTDNEGGAGVPHGGSVDYPPSLDRLCVGSNWPGLGVEFDPLTDWHSIGEGGGGSGGPPPTPGDYPDIEDDIRDACSVRVDTRLNSGGSQYVNASENWSDVLTYSSWYPDQGFNCQVTMELNKDDPTGLEVPWEQVGGTTDPMPLACSLTDDCADWFYPSVLPFTHWTSETGVIEPETRNAAYLAVEDGPTSRVDLDLDMPGSAAGIDDGAPLFGVAEYTPLACGDDVCPFYLASLSAYNTTGAWDIRIETDTNVLVKKRVTNVQIDMIQSTLGVQHMALHKVAFAPGSIRLAVEITVSNQPGQTNNYGNGTHSAIVENVDYVFANYWNNAMTLTHAFPVQAGEGTLTLQVARSESPPEASHDLQSTEACDDPNGLLLTDRVTSTDPDDDIVTDVWWIDGVPCSGECGIPFGSHEVVVEARDARDAADLSETEWVYVTTGC